MDDEAWADLDFYIFGRTAEVVGVDVVGCKRKGSSRILVVYI